MSSCLVRVPLEQISRRSCSALPSILLSNVRSLFNKTDEIAYLLRERSINLVFFVETWLRNDIPDEAVAIPGYNMVRKDRVIRDGGGIICYFGSSLGPSVLTTQEVPALSTCSSEFLPLFFPSLSLLTIACYHPFWNNLSEHTSAIDCISDILDYVAINETFSGNLRVIVLGDFNDLCKLSDLMSNVTQLKPVVNFPTREDNVIDQIFTNCSDAYHPPERLSPIGRSDHCTIVWRPSHAMSKNSKTRVRKFSQSAFYGFYEFINSVDWVGIVESENSVDNAATSFQEHLLHLLDIFFPLRTVRFRSSEPPWMLPSLKLLINDRDRAFTNRQIAKYLRLREEVIKHTCFLKSEFLQKAVSSGCVKSM